MTINIYSQKQQFRAPSDNLKINTCNSPFSVDWDGDGDLDAIFRCQCSTGTGTMHFYENIAGAGEYNFVDRGDIHTRGLNQHEVSATTCDWNKDGIPDLLLVPESGNFYYFANNLQTKN